MKPIAWVMTMLLTMLLTTTMFAGGTAARAAAAESFYAVPFADGVVVVGPSGVPLRLSLAAWGPAFKWAGLDGKLAKDADGAAGDFKMTINESPGKVSVRVKKTGPRQLEVNYELTVEKDISLNMVAVMVEPGTAFAGKERLQVKSPAGDKSLAVPVPMGNSIEGATAFSLTDEAGAITELRMEPGILFWGEGVARLVLAKDTLAGNTPKKLKLTINLPADFAWYASTAEVPDAAGIERWFPWQPKQDVAGDDSAIGMQKWLDAPAGAAGRITNRDGKLFTGERPIRLWGINSNYGENYPDQPEAVRRAAWFAKYGINCVRLHKMAGSGFGFLGIRSKTSAIEFDPAQLDKLDHYTAELSQKGIYYAFSPNYPFSIGPADRDRVESFDEIYKGSGDEADGSGVVYVAPKVQDLLIEQATRLLEHVNPYTKKAYKDDPALAYIECINEESDMFYGYLSGVSSKPTYRSLLAGRFCDWLKAKYGTQEKLAAAWGEPALKGPYKADTGITPDETLEKRNVFPGGNPWYWDPTQLAGSQAPFAKRYFDSMAFLAEIENDFYAKWAAALRKAGYQGMLDFSNWQAGRGFSHFYNLEADSRAGMIDRHNYFGGMGGIGLGLGAFNNDSMLARPGSGILSTGMQQVDGCAFAQSEWIHVLPNEWAAEGPALIGAYGFGLQGWDMDFIFTQGNMKFEDRIEKGSIWNAYQPPIMGLFPAVVRQVMRGDVTEAPLVASMNVHVPSFAQGKGLDFEDSTSQSHDVKSFDSDKVPTETLARGRVAVKFTKDLTPSLAPAELQELRTVPTIESVTKQLSWTRGTGPRDGFFTMNTPATKAVVGFASGKVCKLGPAEIVHHNLFAAVYLTCIDRDATDIVQANRLLVVAVARCRNLGMKFAGDAGMLLDKGTGPMVVEPVSAEIKIDRPGTPTVYVLDHDGRRTEKTLPLKDGKIVLDGAENKTIYYEIEYR